MTTKTFTKRDSATAALRKAGVDKSVYNDYITKNDDGTLTVRFPATGNGDDGSAAAALTKGNVFAALVKKHYITKNDDGTLTVRFPATGNGDDGSAAAALTKGNMFAALVKKPAKAEKQSSKAETPAKSKKAAKNSVSETIRDLIRAGKSNQEIFDKLSTGKNAILDDTKKHYPGWYRCELRRKGEEV